MHERLAPTLACRVSGGSEHGARGDSAHPAALDLADDDAVYSASEESPPRPERPVEKVQNGNADGNGG